MRGKLGHVRLNTTHRYAEITMRMKVESMALCSPAGISKVAPGMRIGRSSPG